jgi:hypothetical protein
MRDQRFELIQPGKWPLDAELLLYESCHARRSTIASIFTTAIARSRDRKERGCSMALLRSSPCFHKLSCRSLREPVSRMMYDWEFLF